VPPTLADRVRHILAAIENIERFLAGKTQQDYADDHFLQLATERLLEIICEASRHIPENVRSCEPGIPWTRMVDFGNRLRHAYHRVDPAIVWSVVANDLPPLKAFAQRIMHG
jgi:uncharacterized protein with HEPN domain